MTKAHIVILLIPGGRIAVATEATEDEAQAAAIQFREQLRDGRTDEYLEFLRGQGYETHCVDWTNRNFEVQL